MNNLNYFILIQMSMNIQEFVNLRKTLDVDELIKVVIEEQVFVGTFKTVYNDIRESTTLKILKTTRLTVTKLDISYSQQIFTWQDELPAIYESIRLYFEFIQENGERHPLIPEWTIIEEFYTQIKNELEYLAIESDEYLQGLAPEPNLEDVKTKFNRLKLLSQPQIFQDWFDAVQAGNVDLVDLYIWNKQDPDANNETEVALHIAASNNDVKMIKVLLDNGADIDKLNASGASPLYVAIREGNVQAVKLLLKRGGTPYIDISNILPLHLAAAKGYFDIVKLLIQAGFDINQVNDIGETALHSACENGHLEVAEYLLENGANPNIETDSIERRYNNTALFLSVCGNHTEIVKLLLKYKADPNSNSYNSNLCIAVRNNNLEIVKLLVEHGDSTDKRNSRGEKPIDIALRYQYTDIAAYLSS